MTTLFVSKQTRARVRVRKVGLDPLMMAVAEVESRGASQRVGTAKAGVGEAGRRGVRLPNSTADPSDSCGN